MALSRILTDRSSLIHFQIYKFHIRVMTISEILHDLEVDADKFHSEDKESVHYYLSNVDSAARIEDKLKRHIRLLAEYDKLAAYCSSHDWISELEGYRIDLDTLSMLSIPAQLIQNYNDMPLTENPFFLGALRLMLTVMLYDDALERAFAAESIVAFLHTFRDYTDDFFETVATMANDMPCHCVPIPKDITGSSFGRLFRLELIRIQSTFSAEFPKYEMYDPEELNRVVSSDFGGADPGYTLTNSVARRLLRVVSYLLENVADEPEE